MLSPSDDIDLNPKLSQKNLEPLLRRIPTSAQSRFSKFWQYGDSEMEGASCTMNVI